MNFPAQMQFELLASDGAARRGRITLAHGMVETPAFMPVGTYGTVKGMTPEEVRETGAQILLGNTFHLWLRPGQEVMRAHAGLHRLHELAGPDPHRLRWFPGVQPGHIRKITEGVHFRHPINGEKIFLDPEKSMEIQYDLGSDIVMIFDECTPYPATYEEARKSMEMSLRWAKRSRDKFDALATRTPCSASSRAPSTSRCGMSPWTVCWRSASTAMRSAVWRWVSPRKTCTASWITSARKFRPTSRAT
jgi:queuine tRNA-ribosyltransferase